MACPEMSLEGYEDVIMPGFLCQAAGTSTCCSTYFSNFTECTSLVLDYWGGEANCVANSTLAQWGFPGTCFFTVGTVAGSSCNTTSLMDPTQRIPHVALVPESAWIFYVLLLLIAGIVGVNFGLHWRNPTNFEFQRAYVLLMLCIALTAVLALLGVFLPMAAPFLEVLMALLEGYVAYLFGGLMVAWAAQTGSVEEALMGYRRSAHSFVLGSCVTGSRFRDGAAALKHWKRQVAQFFFVKLITQTGAMANFYLNDELELRAGYKFLYGILNLVSIVLMLRGLSMLYLALRSRQLLEGFLAAAKFLIVKVLFSCLVVNNIIVSNLLNKNVVQAPEWVCAERAGPDVSEAECNQRFLSFIFICEATILLLLGALAYSHRGLDNVTTGADAHANGTPSAAQLLGGALRRVDARSLWITAEARVRRSRSLSAASASTNGSAVPQPHRDDRKSESEGEGEGEGEGESESEAGSAGRATANGSVWHPKMRKYKRLTWLFGVTAALFLAAALYSPVWLTSELGECKLSVSYLKAIWCHGNCPMSSDTTAALASKQGTLELLLYNVCNADPEPSAWGSIGATVGIISLVTIVLGLTFRTYEKLWVTFVFSLTALVLMLVYGPAAYAANTTVVSLMEVYGATPMKVDVSAALAIIGIANVFVCTFVLHRFHVYHRRHHRDISVDVESDMKDANVEATDDNPFRAAQV